MRAYKNIALIIAIVLVALLVPGGCGVKSQTGFTSTPAGLACIEMMKKVPAYFESDLHFSSISFWDVKTLRSDPDLAEIYREFYDQKVGSFEYWGIDGDSIDYWANEGGVTLMRGDLDLDAIRGNIPADFTRDMDYEALEVWKRSPSQELPYYAGNGIILAEGLFIQCRDESDFDELLSVYEGEEPPMYDEDAAEVLKRLPEAFTTGIGYSGLIEGLIISAIAVVKEEAGAYRFIWVYKFESPEHVASADVEEYFREIEDGMREEESKYAERGESCPFHSFALEKDGEFVELSFIMEEEYMIDVFFHSG